MASQSSSLSPITLYHYPFSPWARKLVSYLTLRRIPFQSCEQPVVPPRPDLSSVGVNYRRIPVLAIGKDIYCDVGLSILKLDQLIPYNSNDGSLDLRPQTPNDAALSDMLHRYVEATLFMAAVTAIPTTFPAFSDRQFMSDRAAFFGRPFDAEVQNKARSQALTTIRAHFEALESGLLKDGRDWLLGGREVSIADLHLGWPYAWLNSIPGSLDGDLAKESGRFPKVWAWIDRYENVVAKAREGVEIEEVNGEKASETVLGSAFAEPGNEGVEDEDALVSGLKKGDLVNAWPLDSGSTHKDRGRLVRLSLIETVIQTDIGTRVHHPRFPFAVAKVEAN